MRQTLKPYPTWVCRDCAFRAIVKQGIHPLTAVSTFHEDTCDVCGKVTAVTEPRDYCYPNFPGHLRIRYDEKKEEWPKQKRRLP